MASPLGHATDSAVTKDAADFDRSTGTMVERIIFNNRLLLLFVCALVTAVMGFSASRLTVNASFNKMIPQSHPYIQNYFDNIAALRSLGNSVRVVVENKTGDIYDPAFLETLRQVNDALFLTRGVDRSFMKSIWSANVRWTENTEQGFRGGPVLPPGFKGTAKNIEDLRVNIDRAGLVGSLVANDQRSAMVFVPLLDRDPETGEPLDYAAFSEALEANIRSLQTASSQIHIVGFAKVVGDLIAGLWQIMGYFAVATLIATVIIYVFIRCLRSTLVILFCSLLAVVWQVGITTALGYVIDPYSILVPFLIFAIGLSHGAQKMNGVMQDIGRGMHRYVAARMTFRRLFIAGLSALMADAVGFGVLSVIDIPVIRDLAITASIGVTLLVFTNLVLLPVILSYVGVEPSAAARSLQAESAGSLTSRIFDFLERCTTRRTAIAMLAAACALAAVGLRVGGELKIGDLDPGAPELRSTSRYNRDNDYITRHYGQSSDQFAVIVKTNASSGIATFKTLIEMDRLEQELRKLPGVQSTLSVAGLERRFTAAAFEGSPKWMSINRDQFVVSNSTNQARSNYPELSNTEYTVAPLIVYLSDHKAETLSRITAAVAAFAAKHNSAELEFLLAAGNAGIEAATNMVVKEADSRMLYMVYGAVVLLCFLTFRNWRAVVVAVIPLVLTSVLSEALMVVLGIGVKVATLPVIALGVGIGVDYALYLISTLLACRQSGMSLARAYRTSLEFTGRMVALVGVTLASGVAIWAFSPIKFQADMGIMLAFMFLWNMAGALVLIPALSHFLLGAERVRGAPPRDVETGAILGSGGAGAPPVAIASSRHK